MERRRVFLAVLLAVLWQVLPWTGAWAGEAEPGWLLSRTVRTEHRVKEKDTTLHQYGSGTVIGKYDGGFYVLTCAHVMENAGRVAEGELVVRMSDNADISATLVYHDVAYDLAVLKVPSKRAVVVADIGTGEEYRAGVKVIKCGYPGTVRSVLSGKLLAWSTTTRRAGTTATNAVSDVKARVGDSGCGLFRQSDKKLIGVIWGGADETSRAVRVADISRFLKDAGAKDRALAAVMK